MPHADDEAPNCCARSRCRTPNSILRARQRAEEELLRSKQALEQTTRELANSLSMLRATLEATADGILVTDRAGRVTDFNERYCELWRLPSDAVRRAAAPAADRTSPRVASPTRRATSRASREIDARRRDRRRRCARAGRRQRVRALHRAPSASTASTSAASGASATSPSAGAPKTALRDETPRARAAEPDRRELASTLDLQALLQAVTDGATQLSGAEFGAFFYNVTDENGDAYMLYTLSGAPREAFERFGHPRATPLFGPTFAGERTIRCDDVRADPRYGQWAPHHGMPPGHLPVRSYLAVPVVSRSRRGDRRAVLRPSGPRRVHRARRSGSSSASPRRRRSRSTTRGSTRRRRASAASASRCSRRSGRRAPRGRAREPHEGRVPRHAVARAAHAAERDPRLVARC